MMYILKRLVYYLKMQLIVIDMAITHFPAAVHISA